MQPVPDATDPQNTVTGNPNLKTALRHNLSGIYNQYFTATSINLNANISFNTIRNKVVRNILLVPDTLNTIKRETSFINANGDYSINIYYYLSKNFSDAIFGLRYSGLAYFNHSPVYNNNIESSAADFKFDQKFEAQINPLKWLEITQKISFTSEKTTFGLSKERNFNKKNLAFTLLGNLYFSSTSGFDFEVSKNYISGFDAILVKNPLVINAGFSKRIFNRKNAVVALKAYDLLKQNTFLSRTKLDNGVKDSKTNSLSRYLMVSFSWAPQKWTGQKNVSGVRNGDGSFRP